MELERYETMDPHMLVGIVNTLLRNHSESLDDLCKTQGVDENVLVQRLKEAGYDYNPDIKAFR